MQAPHDELFHFAFGQPEHAASLLRGMLPAALAGCIDWSTLQRCDTRLSDGETDSAHADLLFTVEIAGLVSFLYVLLEHKSGPDRFTAFQLHRYISRLWARYLQENPGATVLPPVLCVVVHHGRTPWRGPRSLRELIDVSGLPPALGQVLLASQPDLTFHRIDLALVPEEDLGRRIANLFTRLTVLCMQFLRDAPADEAEVALRRWQRLLADLYGAAEAREAFLMLVEYIATITELGRERLRRIFAEVHPDAEHIVMTITGRIERDALQRGIALGEARGEARGKTQGRIEILLQQLATRFGPLDGATIERVRGAPAADVERWAVAVLTASTLDRVFDPE